MIDATDSKTSDMFSSVRKVGRPCTSSDEKRRADAAERARRYRQRKVLVVQAYDFSVTLNSLNINYCWLSKITRARERVPVGNSLGTLF